MKRNTHDVDASARVDASVRVDDSARQAALSFLAAEQARLSNHVSPTVMDPSAVAALKRKAALYDSLAQQGITLNQLKSTYDAAFRDGKKAMCEFRLSFFLSSMVIALGKAGFTTDAIEAVLQRVIHLVETHSHNDLVEQCKRVVGIDTSVYDPPIKTTLKSSADRMAVQRMKSTGITASDLAYEKRIGYEHGWNQVFLLSSWYAATILSVQPNDLTADDYAISTAVPAGAPINTGDGLSTADSVAMNGGVSTIDPEWLLSRMTEVADEEITAEDIRDRAERETGVNISDLIVDLDIEHT